MELGLLCLEERIIGIYCEWSWIGVWKPVGWAGANEEWRKGYSHVFYIFYIHLYSLQRVLSLQILILLPTLFNTSHYFTSDLLLISLFPQTTFQSYMEIFEKNSQIITTATIPLFFRFLMLNFCKLWYSFQNFELS